MSSLLRAGDRLGHALALGADPTEWCRCYPVIRMRKLERRLDLEWLQRAVVMLGVALPGDEHLRLQEELGRLSLPDSRSLFDDLWTLDELDIDHLGLYGNDRESDRDGRTFRAINDGHDDWVDVYTAAELPLLKRLGDALAVAIAERQLVVELNPSSNLLIGHLYGPLDQPRMWTRGLLSDARGALPVTISADDPLAFATELEDEVAYAWAGMMSGGGLSAAYVNGWIRDALDAAWRARFTLPMADFGERRQG